MEQLTGFFRQDNLPAFSHLYSPEQVLSPGRNREWLLRRIMVQQIVYGYLEQLCKRIAMDNIGDRFADLPLGDSLTGDTDFFGELFLCAVFVLPQPREVFCEMYGLIFSYFSSLSSPIISGICPFSSNLR